MCYFFVFLSMDPRPLGHLPTGRALVVSMPPGPFAAGYPGTSGSGSSGSSPLARPQHSLRPTALPARPQAARLSLPAPAGRATMQCTEPQQRVGDRRPARRRRR